MTLRQIRGWRRGLVLTAVLAIAALVGIVSFASAQPETTGCSNASINGAYATIQNGVTIANDTPANVAIVERTVYDGDGNLTGAGTASMNGTIVRFTTSGTYTVQPNCMGSIAVTTSLGNTSHRDFVLADNGKEMFQISTDPGTVITGQRIKQDTSG